MRLLRTPDDRFADLPDWPFPPRYVEVPASAKDPDSRLRIHYVDEGPAEAPPVLLMHGEPSWSYLYRHMIPPLVSEGHRVIAVDLAGFGRSDKPADQADYSNAAHVAWMSAAVFGALDLREITLVGQDWGGLIGLRLVAEDPDRFARVVVANTGLPTGDQPVTEAFLSWQRFAAQTENFDVGTIITMGKVTVLTDAVRAAYDAPFPDDSYKAGARVFPSLVPTSPDDPAAADQRRAWEVLAGFDRPWLTAFSDADPITQGGQRAFLRAVPDAREKTVTGAGHFLQEDAGPQLAGIVAAFIKETS
jgi:haloalkane dehalogenase